MFNLQEKVVLFMLKTINDLQQFFNDRKHFGVKPGLKRMQYLLKRLGHPEKSLRAIHVAGTNGKGSTIQFLQHALMKHHYEVGVFTSPSFTDIRGHILINNKEICERDLLAYMNELLPFVHELDQKNDHPTEFELLTVIAICYFSRNADIALIETGMGGRDDTTNVIHPIVSVITNVSTDHVQFLGETIEEITLHKAGIIKENTSVVVGNVSDDSRKIILDEAYKKQAPVYLLNEHFSFRKIIENKYEWSFRDQLSLTFSLDIHGIYQVENICTALMALYCLQNFGMNFNWRQVITSIEQTELIGRFEKMVEQPTIILDSAHNVAGIKAFIQTIEQRYSNKEKHLLFSGFKDKQLTRMIEPLIDEFHSITLTTFAHERAASLTYMKQLAEKYNLRVSSDWKEEIKSVIDDRKTEDLYFVTGSLHFIAQVRAFILEQINEDYV